MTIRIRQTISKVLDENRNTLNEVVAERFVIYPEQMMQLKNVQTGELVTGFAYVNTEEEIQNYIEVPSIEL